MFWFCSNQFCVELNRYYGGNITIGLLKNSWMLGLLVNLQKIKSRLKITKLKYHLTFFYQFFFFVDLVGQKVGDFSCHQPTHGRIFRFLQKETLYNVFVHPRWVRCAASADHVRQNVLSMAIKEGKWLRIWWHFESISVSERNPSCPLTTWSPVIATCIIETPKL